MRGDRTDGADAGIGLPVNGCRSPDGDRPGDVIAVRCRGCLHCGRCPGLSNCSRSEQGAHLREERSAAPVPASATTGRGLFLPMGAKRGRSTSPCGWHRRPPPFPDYPLAGIAHPRRPPSPKQASTTLLLNPARPSVAEAEARTLCPWRLDEIEAGLWRAPPGAASLPPGPNQSEPYGLV